MGTGNQYAALKTKPPGWTLTQQPDSLDSDDLAPNPTWMWISAPRSFKLNRGIPRVLFTSCSESGVRVKNGHHKAQWQGQENRRVLGPNGQGLSGPKTRRASLASPPSLQGPTSAFP